MSNESTSSRTGSVRASVRAALTAAAVVASLPAPAVPIATNVHRTGFLGTEQRDVIFDAVLSPALLDAIARADGVHVPLIGDGENVEPVTADASAIGIDADGGDDAVTRTLRTDVAATATATGAAIDGALFGEAKVGADVTAVGRATALLGGDGDDTVRTVGPATPDAPLVIAHAGAESKGVSVTLGVDGLLTGEASDQKATSNAATRATARAAGIDGGAGNDVVENGVAVDASAVAKAKSVGVALSIGITRPGGNSILKNPDAEFDGGSLSDTSVSSLAEGAAIDGGAGTDRITNTGMAKVAATSEAATTGVSFEVAGKIAAPDSGTTSDADVEGSATSKAGATATSRAISLAGRAGSDSLVNDGTVDTDASATSTGVQVAVGAEFNVGLKIEPEGDVKGKALTDASSTASSAATGMAGGDDGDTLIDRGHTNVDAIATATGVSASVTLAGNVSYGTKSDDPKDPEPPKDETDDEPKSKAEGSALANAATLAESAATALSGGTGNDSVATAGRTEQVKSEATATGVAAAVTLSAGVGAQSDASVDVSGTAVSDVSVTARSWTAGLAGDEGNDALAHRGALDSLQSKATATGVAASLNVSGNVAYKGDVSGKIEGEAASNARTSATAQLVGLEGGAGADIVESSGTYGTVLSEATATGVAAALGVTAGLAIEGDAKDVEISGKAATDASAASTAIATLIDGGADADVVRNDSNVSAIDSHATARGIAATVQVAGSLAYKGKTEASVSGQAVSKTDVASTAMASGIDGGAGADTVENSGDFRAITATSDAVGVAATASATVAVTVGDKDKPTTSKITIEGGALSSASVRSSATTYGVIGGADGDSITNHGDFGGVTADAGATGVAAALNFASSVTVEGNTNSEVSGYAVTDTSSRANALATAVTAGTGDDVVDNDGVLTANAISRSTGVAASLSVAGALTFKGSQQADIAGSAASDARVEATSLARAIDGGAGRDRIDNRGAITLMRTGAPSADATGVAASLSVAGNAAIKGTATGSTDAVAASNSTVVAEALATGIDGGADADTVTNSGSIVASPTTRAIGVSASLSVSGNMSGEATGAAMSEADVVARSVATGIDAGSGDDTVTNSGAITLGRREEIIGIPIGPPVDADATGIAASLTVSGTIKGDAAGAALARARALAAADAAGIRGGEGADTIGNSATIEARPDARARAVSVAADITVTGTGSAEGSALADARALATARGAGIEGGAGDDTVTNTGSLALASDSDASAVAVGVTIAGAARGSAAGSALADASSLAEAVSVGLDGGAGADSLTSTAAPVSVDAHANSTSHSVSVSVTASGSLGMVSSTTIADASASADAYSAALDGGDDGDTLRNTGRVDAVTESTALAKSAAVSVAAGAGVVGALGASDASALAAARSIGLEGGAGDDTLTNEGTVYAGARSGLSMANATAGSTTVTVTLGAGFVPGTSSADSSATAVARAAGLGGGAGDDHIVNSGTLTVGRAYPVPNGTAHGGPLMASATSTSDTVAVSLTGGASFQDAGADSSATATTRADGIAGGDDADIVENTGDIAVVATAGADAASDTKKISVSLGVAVGSALANAATRSNAFGRGIAGDAGNDGITTSGALAVDAYATSNARTKSLDLSLLSAGVVDQAAVADASASANAEARGLDGGDGADTIVVGNVDAPADDLIDAKARADVASTSASATLSALSASALDQHARAAARSNAHALAIGIDGGRGSDTLESAARITVAATASGSAISSAVANSGLALGSTSGESVADASAVLLAESVGVRGGPLSASSERDDNTIVTLAPIAVTAGAEGNVTASATTSSPINVFGSSTGQAAVDGSATILAHATGLEGGTGDDTIDVKSGVTVGATAGGVIATAATVDAEVVFGAATGSAVSDASAAKAARATGIDTGDGDDTIDNASILRASSAVTGSVSSSSAATAKSFFRSAASNTVARASLSGSTTSEGVLAGAGDDLITNTSIIGVDADAAFVVSARSLATAKSTFSSASARASSAANTTGSADARGISGGAGADTFDNSGIVDVSARGSTQLSSSTVALARSTFGTASTSAESSNYAAGVAKARGIDGDEGDDSLTNTRLVGAIASSDVRADVSTKSSDGPATSDARTLSIADAIAMDAGEGDDTGDNSGTLLASALPRIGLAKRTQGGLVSGQFGIELAGSAVGLAGGGGNDELTNTGVIVAVTGRQLASTTSAAIARNGVIVLDSHRSAADIANYVGKWVRIDLPGGGHFFARVVASDPAGRTFTLDEPLPIDSASGMAYVVLDLADGAADISENSLDVGGAVVVDGRVTSAVEAAGILGDAGFDDVTNESEVRAAASNAIRLGNYQVGEQVSVDLATTSTVAATGIAGEHVVNAGSISVESSALLRADGATAAIQATDVDIAGRASAASTGLDGDSALGNELRNRSTLDTRASAENVAVDRATAIFASSAQRLDFASTSAAVGLRGGSSDDLLVNEEGADASVLAQASGSIQGATVTFPLFGIGRQTSNLVDAALDATATGLELGTGDDGAENAGTLNVNATAAPTAIGSAACNGMSCLAYASSDPTNRETSARADAAATARARGVHGDGGGGVNNVGTLSVSATSTATSFAQAASIVPAQDQSAVTALGAQATRFIDATLQGFAESGLVGRRLRFPDALDLEFVEAESTIAALDAGNKKKFTDAAYAGADPVGMRIRFADTTAGYVSTVTAYDATTGVFTLASDIPTDVVANEGYRLFVSTTEVIAFDSSSGEFTLANPLPVDVAAGDAYSLSIVSALDGPDRFQDETRIGDSIPLGTRVGFAGVAGYSATVIAFDAASGTFTLSASLPATLSLLDVYTLSSDRSEGSSGADAQAYAIGADLGNDGVYVSNSGSMDVRATALADTRAVARGGGAAPASAVGVVEARAIRTGGGDDTIANTGTLDVTAVVTANANTSTISRRTLAVGIETGAGDDVVVNAGTLTVMAAVAGSAASGADELEAWGMTTGAGDDDVTQSGLVTSPTSGFVAIDTGDGADRLSLGSASVTHGSVQLGIGDDVLAINAGATVAAIGGGAARIDAGAGNDALELTGAGTYDGALVSFESLTKRGHGTFSLESLPSLAELSIETGGIRVAADYTFAEGGRFSIPIAGSGATGSLAATGRIALDGELIVTRETGPFTDGTSFDVVQAAGGIADGTAFDAVTLPASSALVAFRYTQLPGLSRIVADVAPFTTFAGDPVQRGTAEYLDRLLPSAKGDVSALLDHLQQQSSAALAPSYAALSPAHYGVARRVAVDGVSQYVRGLQHRLSVLRLGEPATDDAGAMTETRKGMWFDAFGRRGTRDAGQGFASYDVDTYGATLGFDAPLGDVWLVGLGIGRGRADVDFGATTESSRQHATFTSLYGSWFPGRAYVDTSVAWSFGEHDDARAVGVVGLPALSTAARHDVDAFGAFAQTGFGFSGRSGMLEPFASLRYTRVKESEFAESGGGAIALKLAPRTTESLVGELGLRASLIVPTERGELIPEFGLAWVHEFEPEDSNVGAAFAGSPDVGFTIPGKAAVADGGRVSLGIGFRSGGGFSTLLRYSGEFRSDDRSHGLQGQFRFEF